MDNKAWKNIDTIKKNISVKAIVEGGVIVGKIITRYTKIHAYTTLILKNHIFYEKNCGFRCDSEQKNIKKIVENNIEFFESLGISSNRELSLDFLERAGVLEIYEII